MLTADQKRLQADVLKYVYAELHVLPWLVISGRHLAYVVEARALAAMILRGLGLSYRQVAALLHMHSASSVYELIHAYQHRPKLREAVTRFAATRSEQASFSVAEAFGNSTTLDSDAATSGGGGGA